MSEEDNDNDTFYEDNKVEESLENDAFNEDNKVEKNLENDAFNEDTEIKENHDYETSIEETKVKESNLKTEIETEIKTVEQKIHYSWKEFLRKQVINLFGLFVMIILLLAIIHLSDDISGDRNAFNPSNVISVSDSIHIYLMISASILFLATLFIFTKIIFLDDRKDFNIDTMKSMKGIIFFLLTIDFVAIVYLLLDVALVNVYLMTAPTYIIWSLKPFDKWGIVPTGTDRIAYNKIRTGFFTFEYFSLLVFPLVMFIIILTRIGRKQYTKYIEKNRESREKDKSRFQRFVFFIIIPIIETGIILLYTRYSSTISSSPILILVLALMVGLGIAWIFLLLMYVINLIRFLSFFTFSNTMLVIPILSLFYIGPVLIWSIWDVFAINAYHSIHSTVYDLIGPTRISNLAIDPRTYSFNYHNLNELFSFFAQCVLLNSTQLIRIIELDFVFTLGVAAAVIGFAEGYSIVAIGQSIFKGVNIARTGSVASESAPQVIVISSKLVYLSAWLSLLLDKLRIVWDLLRIKLRVALPNIYIPSVFYEVYHLATSVVHIRGFFAPIIILIVPIYFIFTSALKFLSVDIAAERVKNDQQVFILLISSAFVLIATQIYINITSLPIFTGVQQKFLPLYQTSAINILPFATSLFDTIEGITFYLGVLFVVVLIFRWIKNKIKGN